MWRYMRRVGENVSFRRRPYDLSSELSFFRTKKGPENAIPSIFAKIRWRQLSGALIFNERSASED